MKEITLIQDELRQHFGWHGARLQFLALSLVALFRVRTVNLSALSLGMPSSATPDSRYKRLQRFFYGFELDYHDWCLGIMNLMNIPQPWTLAIDRTNWKFGYTDHNILMLAVVHEGVAIPLLWWMSDKRGNSNTEERILLMEDFRYLFPDINVAALTADREFVGTDWFEYLLDEGKIPFRIRIRESELLFDGPQTVNGRRLFESLKVGERRVLKRSRRLWDHWVHITALRLPDQELMIIVTQNAIETAISDYANRHPNTATSLNNLASLYSSMEQYNQALPLFESALEIRRSELVDRNPSIATSLNNLAILYYNTNRFSEASQAMTEALNIHEQVLGIEHSDTVNSREGLAAIKLRMTN